MSSTKLIFINPSTKKTIELSVIPEEASHSYSANWNQHDLLGRLSPIYTYLNNTEESYSFSVVLHEDLDSKGNITETVDNIKSLSYPTLTKDGVLKAPEVYFSLGEINGFGIVSTNIQWNKPFRSGRYIYVTIDFHIIVEDKETLPTMLEIVEDIEGSSFLKDSYYADTVLFRSSPSVYKSISNNLNNYNSFNSSISDLITPRDTKELISIEEGWLIDDFNYVLGRLEHIHEISNLAQEGLGKHSQALLNLVKDYEELATHTNTSGKLNKAHKTSIESKINGYIEYLHSVKPLTSKEKERIKDELMGDILLLAKLAREIEGYGESS